MFSTCSPLVSKYSKLTYLFPSAQCLPGTIRVPRTISSGQQLYSLTTPPRLARLQPVLVTTEDIYSFSHDDLFSTTKNSRIDETFPKVLCTAWSFRRFSSATARGEEGEL